jgi:lipoyl(octanoyl) transferase
LPYALADGPFNMAQDEVLLEAAVRGTASLRFDGWSEATVSLGYFQPERLRHADERLAYLPYVRRPTGGATLVHHHEVTYALSLPAGVSWQTGESWLCRMHRIISAALNRLRIPSQLHTAVAERPFAGVLCFQHFTSGDVLIGRAKIVGSAQRKQRGALLQHGAILLARSPFAPALPGIRELSGQTFTGEATASAVAREFADQTGWDLVPSEWSTAERLRAEELANAKYSQEAWNRKR